MFQHPEAFILKESPDSYNIRASLFNSLVISDSFFKFVAQLENKLNN
ncbi:MAG: hypothetical protein ACXVEB_03790 [Bacteroidia bacterium]